MMSSSSKLLVSALDNLSISLTRKKKTLAAGVGQSEISVVDMCDMLCLLLSPAHGDELQVSGVSF